MLDTQKRLLYNNNDEKADHSGGKGMSKKKTSKKDAQKSFKKGDER